MKKFLLSIVIGFILLGELRSETYNVLVPNIPKTLNFKEFNFVPFFFILRQLHETIFKNVTESKYETDIIDSLTINNNFKMFTLCLKTGLNFSNGDAVIVDHLLFNLKLHVENKVLKKTPLSITKKNKQCLSIVFESSYYKFIYDLSVEKSIFIHPKSINDRSLLGISPYKISKWTEEILVLKAWEKTQQPNIKTINFYKWANNHEKRKSLGYNLASIDDFNKIVPTQDQKPYLIKQNKIPIVSMITIGLILNIQDSGLRKTVWNCTKLDNLRRIYPELDFLPIKAYLPVGFLGGERGNVSQKCQSQKEKVIKKLKVVTYRKELAERFQSILDKDLVPLNIKPEVVYYEAPEFTKVIGEGKYDIMLTSMDMDYIDYMRNFEIFYSKSKLKLTSVENPILNKYYVIFPDLANYESKEQVLKTMSRSLVENHQILIMGQISRDYYFSKKFIWPLNEKINANYQIKNLKRSQNYK